MIPKHVNLKSRKLPDSPGVYLMKGRGGEILYIGKAANLRRRVSSYFERPHEYRIQKLVSEIQAIDYKKTDTAIEALILESELIKKYQPPYNVREKDDKSFLYVEITHEKFPRVLLVRGKDFGDHDGKRLAPSEVEWFGPFTLATSIREALRLIRRIFPYSIHTSDTIGKFKRPCFETEIGLCPGTCVGAIGRKEYLKTIRNIKLFFGGKKSRILSGLKRQMRSASRSLEFEKAEKLKRQIFSLEHIQDIALIRDDELNAQRSTLNAFRIEGYDISNISGTSAVGSMAVFINGTPDRNEYRKFRIKTVFGSNDVAMLKEVLERRLKHAEWRYPDLILIDGGVGQVNGAKAILRAAYLAIPVVGIAKGPERRKNEFIGKIPAIVNPKVLIQLRDEAHRFAIRYHREVRTYRAYHAH